MKKTIIIFLILFLFSCFWDKKDEIQEAKKEIFSTGENISTQNDIQQNTDNNEQNNIVDDINKSYYNINYLLWDKIIDIENINNIENIIDKLDIKWIVSNSEIDKIIISFENQDSIFPDDIYVLQTFKKWDNTFLYRAYKKYQVLDYWLNKYKIEAFIWENIISSFELEVFIWKNIKDNSMIDEYINATIWLEDDNIFLSLPVLENFYWSPIKLWENWFTYSLIDDFEVYKNSSIYDFNCENYWDYLKENYSWYYWNTCKSIWDDSFSINVLYLQNDNYFYEKHYIDKRHWFFWKVLLEKWVWVDNSNISNKNTQLKNQTFEVISKTDKLFQDLLK